MLRSIPFEPLMKFYFIVVRGQWDSSDYLLKYSQHVFYTTPNLCQPCFFSSFVSLNLNRTRIRHHNKESFFQWRFESPYALRSSSLQNLCHRFVVVALKVVKFVRVISMYTLPSTRCRFRVFCCSLCIQGPKSVFLSLPAEEIHIGNITPDTFIKWKMHIN